MTLGKTHNSQHLAVRCVQASTSLIITMQPPTGGGSGSGGGARSGLPQLAPSFVPQNQPPQQHTLAALEEHLRQFLGAVRQPRNAYVLFQEGMRCAVSHNLCGILGPRNTITPLCFTPLILFIILFILINSKAQHVRAPSSCH